MKKSLSVFLLVSFTLLTYSCYDKERELRLDQRERALQVREDSLALKENEYMELLKMRDSLVAVRDSINSLPVQPWPDSIAGKWSSKLICTESNCNDYVIGDQRTYTWMFESDSLKNFIKVLNNKDELLREYIAGNTHPDIHLLFKTDSTISKSVTMDVQLNKIQKDKMRGIHLIRINDNCTAKFSVELTRPSSGK